MSLLVVAGIWLSLVMLLVWLIHRGFPRLGAWLEARSTWGQDVLDQYDLERIEWEDRNRDLQYRLDLATTKLRRLVPRGGPTHVIVGQAEIHDLLDRLDPDEDWRKGASA